MRVVGTTIDPPATTPSSLAWLGNATLPDDTRRAVAEADYLLIACPLTLATRGMFNDQLLASEAAAFPLFSLLFPAALLLPTCVKEDRCPQ